MYALVEIKGKQYKVEEGAILKVDKYPNEKGDVLEFGSVVMLRNGEDTRVGDPYLDDVKIKATVEDHTRGKKVIVFKYKKRKNYRRKQGHRQDYSLIKINEIITA